MTQKHGGTTAQVDAIVSLPSSDGDPPLFDVWAELDAIATDRTGLSGFISGRLRTGDAQ
jgi:hypothetical protein